jgi:hypothetical protein
MSALIGLTFALAFLASDPDFLIIYGLLGLLVGAGWMQHITVCARQIMGIFMNAETEILRKKAKLIVVFSVATLCWAAMVVFMGSLALALDIWLSNVVLMVEGSVFVLWWVFFGVCRFAADVSGEAGEELQGSRLVSLAEPDCQAQVVILV